MCVDLFNIVRVEFIGAISNFMMKLLNFYYPLIISYENANNKHHMILPGIAPYLVTSINRGESVESICYKNYAAVTNILQPILKFITIIAVA